MSRVNDIKKQFDPYLSGMNGSPLKSYIIDRVIGQIAWYDKKSIEKQKLFTMLSIMAIMLNAVIPVMVLLSDECLLVKVLIAGLSSAAGAISSIITLCSYKDLWVHYRSNCEMLQSILYRFFLRVGEFKQIANDEAVLKDTLVIACENYFTKEFQTWVSIADEDPLNGAK